MMNPVDIFELFKRYTVALSLVLILFAPAATGYSFGRTSSTPIPSSAPSDSLSTRDRIEIFEEIWEIIDEKYYDPTFNGVDWRAVRDRYRPLAAQAEGEEQFYSLLKRMVGELRDAHTRFHTPEERREREREQAVSVGLSIFEVEGKSVIVGVDADSEAARAGVEPGMIVLSVDGQPIDQRLKVARLRVAGSSSDRAITLRVYRMIVGGDTGTILRMRLARADGSTLDVALTRRVVSDAPTVTSRRLPSGLGYIRLTLWKSPIRKQFKRALEQLRYAPGIVIDIRGNPGGEAGEVVKIASLFFDSHVSFGKFSTRGGRSVYLRTDDDEQIYKGPVAILVNEGSGSGSELFAGVMQENRRAVVIGRQSCGCVLGISKFRSLKGKGELAVSEFGYRSPQGKTFEGSGVTPDRKVELKLADLQHGRDAALDEAERLLKTNNGSKVAQR